jgi:hypothetical protein
VGLTYATLREWVLALPGTQEVFVEQWGDYTLRCGAKMFVVGDPESSFASVKASLDDQAELLAGAPDTYSKAAYVGRFGWVRVDLTKADPAELRRIVVDAWRRTAPKKLIREYDSAAKTQGSAQR